jgi:hypothetical protein
MSEIRQTLEQIRRRLNESINAVHPRRDDWVVLSNIADDSGNASDWVKDKLVMTLANIQRETTISTYNSSVAVRKEMYASIAPPIYINLHVLFYANFIDRSYPEGLGAIERTIYFFQENQWFTHANLPELSPAIAKLQFELENLDVVDSNYLVGMMGAKYLPLVLYKVRTIPFQAGAVQAETPAVQGVANPSDVLDPPPQPADEDDD